MKMMVMYVSDTGAEYDNPGDAIKSDLYAELVGVFGGLVEQQEARAAAQIVLRCVADVKECLTRYERAIADEKQR